MNNRLGRVYTTVNKVENIFKKPSSSSNSSILLPLQVVLCTRQTDPFAPSLTPHPANCCVLITPRHYSRRSSVHWIICCCCCCTRDCWPVSSTTAGQKNWPQNNTSQQRGGRRTVVLGCQNGNSTPDLPREEVTECIVLTAPTRFILISHCAERGTGTHPKS